MNYRSFLKQNRFPLLLIALAFPVSVTTSALYANATEVSITQQTKAISGVVFDGGLNEPLIGANVVVKGTTNGFWSSVVLVSKHLKLKPRKRQMEKSF